jgi:hypothetical protein
LAALRLRHWRQDRDLGARAAVLNQAGRATPVKRMKSVTAVS